MPDIDITNLPDIGTPTEANDTIVTYDSSAAAGSRITALHFNGVGTSYLSGNGAWADSFGTGQTSAGTALGDATTVEINGFINSPYFSFGEYQNHLLQTEAFDNASWVEVNVAAIVANEGISPIGTLVAERIAAETVKDGTGEVYQSVTNSTTGNWTFSVWLKAQSGTATINLRVDTSGGAGGETGTVQPISLTTAWKRYSVTQSLTVGHTTKTVRILNGDNAIVAWGAQLEPQATASGYSSNLTTTGVTTQTNLSRIRNGLSLSGTLNVNGVATFGTVSILSASAIVDRPSITTTSTDALVARNVTASLVGTTVQMSPRLRFSGTVWDTGTTTSKTVNFIKEVLPVSGNPGTGYVRWGYDYNGGGYGYLMYLTSGGMLGIGAVPSTMLDITGADNSTVQTIRIAAAQANVTAADTFIDFRSTSGSEGTIAGTAVAGVVAYNTFTGSHYTQIVDKTGLEVNMLLEIVEGTPEFVPQSRTEREDYLDTTIDKDEDGNDIVDEKGNPFISKQEIKQKEVEKEYKASPKGQLFNTRISATRKSTAAVGVYGGTDKEGRDLCLSIGTGFMWVANKGVDLEIGDYLISSDLKGCAERQADDIYRSSTIGKITEPLKWNIGETRRLVKVIYLGG